MADYKILVVNPGSLSTKIAIFEDEKVVFAHTIVHKSKELGQFPKVIDQLSWRIDMVLENLEELEIGLDSLAAVVGRGGRFTPVESGTIEINESMLDCARSSRLGQHASNLGCLISYELAKRGGIPAYVVDPVSVDEMWPLSKITGLPEIKRISLSHALNMKAVARKVAGDLDMSYYDGNFIVAHLGGGGSVSIHYKGRMVDLLNSDVEGPFSMERAGGLPSWGLIELCFADGALKENIWSRISGGGGIFAHLGTKDAQAVEKRIKKNDGQAKLIYKALAYNVAKAIGAMAVSVGGDVNAIVITGGLAHSSMLCNWISEKVQFIAPIFIYPGGFEMEALALGALRVLRREELAKIFIGPSDE